MEHFIKNIEITNFKSIRHAEIKDCRRVNVFVGYPNVGKSNILEAMSLFSVLRDLHIVNFKDLIRVTNDPTLFFDGSIEKKVEITIDDEFSIDGIYREGKLAFSIYNLKLSGKPDLSGWGELEQDVPLRYNTTTFRNFDKAESDGRQSHDKTFNRFPRFKKYEFKKDIPVNLGDFQVLTYPFGNNLFSVIQTNLSIRKELAELLGTYNLEMLFDSSYQKFSIFKRTELGIFSIDYELIADTLQRLFFYKTAILSNKNQVLLFEEPESHMFPPYISKMTGDIIYDENNNQFFIATHTPYVLGDLIRDVEPEELSVYIVGYDAAKGETIIYRMDEKEVNEAYQFGHDFFMNIDNFIPNEYEQV